ncbi:MAG: hypothetical protein R3212_11825 [Xanthomonadales bacterium]|nr:hypothetical protein [Xanthomonadales bacterium]
MTDIEERDNFEPALAQIPSDRQRWFLRYYTGVLIDLVVLNLFVEYSQYVQIDSFTVSVFAAILLQVLLKLTLVVEHKAASYFKSKPGTTAKVMRWVVAWLILFGSKFVILEAVNLAFGDKVYFGGWLHGVVAIIAVLVVMLVVEEAIVRFYRKLA